MLYDLSFLQTGAAWPPPSEKQRLDDYKAHRDLFSGKHAEVYRAQFRRVERITGLDGAHISYPIILNYHRLISLKMADLVFAEQPKITVSEDSAQKTLDKILTETDLLNRAYSAAIDVSRYGDAVLALSLADKDVLSVDGSSPDRWFPVVDKGNIQKRLYDVQAWHYCADPKREDYELRVVIHAPGQTEELRYALRKGGGDSFVIGRELERRSESTGLSASALSTAHNVLTTDSIFGVSDYEIIDSVLWEIMIRVTQISKVLDAHSSPSMSGPDSALENPDGVWVFKAGNYFPRASSDEPPLEYITWDASLEANFKQIEFLLHQLYSLSEMGSAIFGDLKTSTGAIPSGTALRRLMMSPLAKASRVKNSFDRALKRLLESALSLRGIQTQVSIAWKDGLPDDEAEQAQIAATRTGSKATLSQWSAIQRLDDLSDADTRTELDMIRADEEMSTGIGLAEPGPDDT